MPKELVFTLLVLVGMLLALTIVVRRTWLKDVPKMIRTDRSQKWQAAQRALGELSHAEDCAKGKAALALFAAARKAHWKEGKVCAKEALCRYYSSAEYIEIHKNGKRVARFRNTYVPKTQYNRVQVLQIGY